MQFKYDIGALFDIAHNTLLQGKSKTAEAKTEFLRKQRKNPRERYLGHEITVFCNHPVCLQPIKRVMAEKCIIQGNLTTISSEI